MKYGYMSSRCGVQAAAPFAKSFRIKQSMRGTCASSMRMEILATPLWRGDLTTRLPIHIRKSLEDCMMMWYLSSHHSHSWGKRIIISKRQLGLYNVFKTSLSFTARPFNNNYNNSKKCLEEEQRAMPAAFAMSHQPLPCPSSLCHVPEAFAMSPHPLADES